MEGSSANSTHVFVLGARAIANDLYDLNFNGNIAGAVLLSTGAPSGFSTCVLSCLESLVANTSGTAITSTGFNVTSRTLRLVGIAPPSDYQTVLRSLTYINQAMATNVNSITVSINDGVSTSHTTFPVTAGSGRRRRAALGRRRLLSIPHPAEQRENVPMSGNQSYLFSTTLLAMTVCSTIVIISIIVVASRWKSKQSSSSLPA